MIVTACATLVPSVSSAEEVVRVAVASNFSRPMKELAEAFEQSQSQRLRVSYGSTGKLYSQIVNGAPFDVFLSADAQRPHLLEQSGHGLASSRFVYASGRLVLWSPQEEKVGPGGSVLADDTWRHLSIANPRLAPYGAAAMQVIERLGFEDAVSARLVLGENISQAYQFVRSGNAELGFIARSQWSVLPDPGSGSHWEVPVDLHSPIDQQAIALNRNAGVETFMTFLKSAAARAIIVAHGYDVPDAD